MPEKTVILINDPTSRTPAVKRPAVRKSAPSRPSRRTRAASGPNPGAAFSYSLLSWGGGQLHNGQEKRAVALFLLLAVFFLSVGIVAVERSRLSAYALTYGVSVSFLLKAAAAFWVFSLSVWMFSCLQAYWKGNRLSGKSFKGTDTVFLPPLLSLLVPGWGQFLNGQPLKGTFFFFLFGSTLAAALIAGQGILLWASIQATAVQPLWEGSLAVGIVLSLILAVTWPLSVYDALRVAMNEIKKEPPWKRLRLAWNRWRVLGWRKGVMPEQKGILFLTLILSISLLLAYYFLSTDYYVWKIRELASRAVAADLHIIPGFLEHLADLIS